jgi:hypothetical protein
MAARCVVGDGDGDGVTEFSITVILMTVFDERVVTCAKLTRLVFITELS